MSYLQYTDRKDLVELAYYDDADAYEVDEGGIFWDGTKFILATASGCSCWDGDFNEEEYQTLDQLEQDLLKGDRDGNDVIMWAPSLNQAKRIIAEAKANWINHEQQNR